MTIWHPRTEDGADEAPAATGVSGYAAVVTGDPVITAADWRAHMRDDAPAPCAGCASLQRQVDTLRTLWAQGAAERDALARELEAAEAKWRGAVAFTEELARREARMQRERDAARARVAELERGRKAKRKERG